jgi:hypothetical protein
MSYDVNARKSYNSPADTVSRNAAQILEQLGGKVSEKSSPAKGQLEATFNKKVKDKSLPNRCQVRVKVVSQSADSCDVMAKVYPVDPMGNKLTFGVRGNAAQVVSDTFLTELEARIGA